MSQRKKADEGSAGAPEGAGAGFPCADAKAAAGERKIKLGEFAGRARLRACQKTLLKERSLDMMTEGEWKALLESESKRAAR